MKFLTKLIFLIKRPRIIVIENDEVAEVIFNLLKLYFKAGNLGGKPTGFLNVLTKEVLILNSKNKKIEFFLKKSKLSILIIGQIDDSNIKLIKILKPTDYLVLNFDNVELRALERETASKTLNFGFWEGADIQASDINFEEEIINFKLNYGGGFVPMWLKVASEIKKEEKDIIHPILTVTSTGIILGLNLVEISQGLKLSGD